MSEENTFNTHENDKIEEIIKDAFSKFSEEDKEGRAKFVEDKCGGNVIMFEYVMKCLDEMDSGEEGFTDLTLEEGCEIGNYIIIKKISDKGGIASVYSAEHKVLKTLAAIKVFDKQLLSSIENYLFWKTDHSALAKFNHDNIIKLYDVGEYEKNGTHLPFMAVEYVVGNPLGKHCESKILTIRELLKLFQDLCEVVEFVHDKGEILHLDLKPDNILVTADRPHRIKLIDFGSSKSAHTESKHFTRWDLVNPVTLKFAAPEQFGHQNEVPTNQADIYSLGVIMYLLITGKFPLGEMVNDRVKITREVTDMNLLPGIPSKRVLELKDETKFGVPLKALSQILNGDLDSIIMKALAKRRRDRYQSVSEFRRDIDNFLKGKPVRARRKTAGYKTIKSFTQFWGFKGGSAGWEKWKSPVKRLSVAAFFLALLVTTGTIYYQLYSQYKASSESLIGRKTEGASSESDIVTIFCGPKAQEKLCFTFIKIPRGDFFTGSQGNEDFKSEFTDIKNRPKNLRKSDKFTKVPGMQAGPSTTSRNIETYALPSQEVAIPEDFYMAKFEITNRQWNIVAEKSSGDTKLEMSNDDSFLPKTNVTYDEAVKFCKILTAELQSKKMEVRLPTEVEWEYACKAGNEKNTVVSAAAGVGSNTVNAISLPPDAPPWVKEILQNVNKPWPESSFPPNTIGLVGMNGNVWELATMDAQEVAFGETQKNSATYVLRGGAYNEDVFTTECFYRRTPAAIFERNGQTGFRVVMTMGPKK